MNRHFQSELEDLRARLIVMGERALEILETSVNGLLQQDIQLCEAAIAMDDEIDNLEIEIDKEAMRYLTLRSPVASDLRLIKLSIKTGINFERIGDESTSIAKRTRKLLSAGPIELDLFFLEEMTVITKDMLSTSLDLLINPDINRAIALCQKDKQVDDLNKKNFDAFTDQVPIQPESGKLLLEISMISKAIERVADHATNVAEELIYLIEGEEIKGKAVKSISLS